MKNISVIFLLWIFASKCYAVNVDCPDATIKAVIDSPVSTILHISSSCGVENYCLDAEDRYRSTLVNMRFYAHAMSMYVNNKVSPRFSYNSDISVENCGYPLVTEMR